MEIYHYIGLETIWIAKSLVCFFKNDLIVVNNCNIDDNDKDAGTYTKYMYRTTVRRAKERLDAQGFGLNNFEKYLMMKWFKQ